MFSNRGRNIPSPSYGLMEGELLYVCICVGVDFQGKFDIKGGRGEIFGGRFWGKKQETNDGGKGCELTT